MTAEYSEKHKWRRQSACLVPYSHNIHNQKRPEATVKNIHYQLQQNGLRHERTDNNSFEDLEAAETKGPYNIYKRAI